MSRVPPRELRDRFVEAATAKFARAVSDFVALRQLVVEQGGTFRNDHGAIRTADPAVCDRFERAAALMGLRRELSYAFPAKKLRSFDLQVIGEDADAFKVFVSEVDLDAFPADVAALVREDCAEQAAAVDHAAFDALVADGARVGGLSSAGADTFIDHLVNRVMTRPGAPMKRATLNAVARVSGEAASALALGPDFNHVTIDVGPSGFADIEAMAAAMAARGFRMLPNIQGARGTKLRQTATMAATMPTSVREADGASGTAPTEKQFVEIIQRAQAVSRFGDPLWRQDGRPLIFRNFLASNAEKIFDAASTKAV